MKPTFFQSLLSMPSIREKENKKVGEEILDLLSKPTAKERSLAERFRSQGGENHIQCCVTLQCHPTHSTPVI
jgi:mRNA (2'-O-methyladenosine-N6-)-methyltransferase